MLKRTTLVLLMITFEILLISVHIQPAQALMCYGCPDPKLEAGEKCLLSGAASTTKIRCPEGELFCYENEIRFLDGRTAPIISKGCGDWPGNKLSCEEFQPWETSPVAGPSEIKMCICQMDLCNRKLGQKENVSEKVKESKKEKKSEEVKESEKNHASIRIRCLGQLFLFCIIVSVSASWT